MRAINNEQKKSEKNHNIYLKLYIFYILPHHNLLSHLRSMIRKQLILMSFKQTSHSSQLWGEKKRVPIQGGRKSHFVPCHRLSYQMEFRSTQPNQTKSDFRTVRHILCSISRCLMSGLELTEHPGNLLWEQALSAFHSEITVELAKPGMYMPTVPLSTV